MSLFSDAVSCFRLSFVLKSASKSGSHSSALRSGSYWVGNDFGRSYFTSISPSTSLNNFLFVKVYLYFQKISLLNVSLQKFLNFHNEVRVIFVNLLSWISDRISNQQKSFCGLQTVFIEHTFQCLINVHSIFYLVPACTFYRELADPSANKVLLEVVLALRSIRSRLSHAHSDLSPVSHFKLVCCLQQVKFVIMLPFSHISFSLRFDQLVVVTTTVRSRRQWFSATLKALKYSSF